METMIRGSGITFMILPIRTQEPPSANRDETTVFLPSVSLYTPQKTRGEVRNNWMEPLYDFGERLSSWNTMYPSLGGLKQNRVPQECRDCRQGSLLYQQ